MTRRKLRARSRASQQKGRRAGYKWQRVVAQLSTQNKAAAYIQRLYRGHAVRRPALCARQWRQLQLLTVSICML